MAQGDGRKAAEALLTQAFVTDFITTPTQLAEVKGSQCSWKSIKGS
jgi:hypothetical protein